MVAEDAAAGTEFFVYRTGVWSLSRIAQAGLDIDIVGLDTELQSYAFVAVPSMPYVPDVLAERLERFDGVLLVMPRTGSRTRSHCIPANLAPGPLAETLGVSVTRVESFRKGAAVPVAFENETFRFDRWREFLTVGDAEVLAWTEDGHAALTRKGRAYYLPGAPDAPFFTRLVRRLVHEAGVGIMELPAGLRTRRRGGYRFVFNYGPELVDASALIDGELVLGEPMLAVGGIAVVREAQ